jgi:hypothetical protein
MTFASGIVWHIMRANGTAVFEMKKDAVLRNKTGWNREYP